MSHNNNIKVSNQQIVVKILMQYEALRHKFLRRYNIVTYIVLFITSYARKRIITYVSNTTFSSYLMKQIIILEGEDVAFIKILLQNVEEFMCGVNSLCSSTSHHHSTNSFFLNQ